MQRPDAKFELFHNLIDYQCVRGLERRRGWGAMAAFAVLTLPLALMPPSAQVAEQTQLESQVHSAPAGSAEKTQLKKQATAKRRIVVSIPDRKLAVVEQGRAKRIYRV